MFWGRVLFSFRGLVFGLYYEYGLRIPFKHRWLCVFLGAVLLVEDFCSLFNFLSIAECSAGLLDGALSWVLRR
jgi:hypothetical protein